MNNIIRLLSLLFLISSIGTSCNKRSHCPAYQELGTVSVLEGGTKYEPTASLEAERSKKTNLVKKVGWVKKKNPSSQWAKSRIKKKDKNYLKDPELFPDPKLEKKLKKKNKKSSKDDKNQQEASPATQEAPEEETPSEDDDKF